MGQTALAALKAFKHPNKVYHLDYPGHWDEVIEKEGASCGFGPHERDDVGLWISIMPISVDTERIAEDLQMLFQKSLPDTAAANLRKDPTLNHFGLVAEQIKEGEGGHYWILAGGDVVLFASSQVPAAEKDIWNPPFFKLMSSLQITRENELLMRKVANDIIAKLQAKHPDEKFEFEPGNQIRGERSVVYLSNVYREVKASPERQEKITSHFVDTLSRPDAADIGQEEWLDVQDIILPILKPIEYIRDEGPTKHMLTTEWLPGVIICYAIHNAKMFRFVTGWDVDRWGTTIEALHKLAIDNLADLEWPREMMGSRDPKSGGRVIVVDTGDSLASSRLLHPELHKMFSGPLGTPFWAGIPCRDTLVLYSDRKELKQRIGRKILKDHRASAYSITAESFMVTRDGIAPGIKKSNGKS